MSADKQHANLGLDDVRRLAHDASSDTRIATARKIADSFNAGLSSAEQAIAEDILRAMLRDAEVRVREALSQSLKDNPDIPSDIAQGLARDIAGVAVPILRCSSVLTDADLIDIVSGFGPEHQIAVAGRPTVSAAVSDALVDSDNETVIAALVANDGAEVRETTLHRVLDTYGASQAVNAPLSRRGSLPIGIAERLVTLVSDSLKDHLLAHHDLPGDAVIDLVMESRERATVGLLSAGADEADVLDLVAQLHDNARLTPSIVLRALCMGDVVFFEAALARLAEVPLANTHKLIDDAGGRGLETLYRRAGLPDGLLPFFKVAIDVRRETDYDGGPNDRTRFVARMIERVLTTCEDQMSGDDLEYLLTKLRGRRPKAA